MITHKHLVAHRQRACQPVDITAHMNEHHVLQNSSHTMICIIENDVESAKVDIVFQLRFRIFSLIFFTSRSQWLYKGCPILVLLFLSAPFKQRVSVIFASASPAFVSPWSHETKAIQPSQAIAIDTRNLSSPPAYLIPFISYIMIKYNNY